MPNEKDEIKQCAVCKCGSKTDHGNVTPYFREFSRDKETGKGYTVQRYICDQCKGATDQAINKVVDSVESLPTATRLAMRMG